MRPGSRRIIEPFVALIITIAALGWIVWRLRYHEPRHNGRLGLMIILMVFVAFAVELYLPDDYSARIQLWFGPLIAILMAAATFVETEPEPG